MRRADGPLRTSRPNPCRFSLLMCSFLWLTSLAFAFLAVMLLGGLHMLQFEDHVQRGLRSVEPYGSYDNKPTTRNDRRRQQPVHCLGLGDYFDEVSYATAVDSLVQYHQKGGNLKSVQKFMDSSIDYTLDKLDLQFIPNEKAGQGAVKTNNVTEFLKIYYEKNPSPRQGYGEPLPGVWSDQNHKALFGKRTIDVMERREGRKKWDAGLGPIGPACRHEIMLGDLKGDGYKFMCVPQPLATPANGSIDSPMHAAPTQKRTAKTNYQQNNSSSSRNNNNSTCHVISVGGNDNWKFEQSVVDTLGCETYTFDCTLPGGAPQRKPNDNRIHFFNYCIDGHDYIDVHGRKFVTYDRLLALAGIETAPEYFKIDVEGYEYDIFTQMVNNDHALLPRQIQVEMHWGTRMTGLPWMPRMRSTAEIALFMATLFNAGGYMPVKLDFNPYCTSCMEVLLFRGGTTCSVTNHS